MRKRNLSLCFRGTGAADTSQISSLVGLGLVAGFLVLTGCVDFLSSRESDIQGATHAIETARDDAERAKAYSARGTAYSEKARYGRATKRIPNDEYERLFHLAMEDHNRAVALNPADAGVYFNRAQTYYDRAAWDLVEHKDSSKSWFDSAASDFEEVLRKDPKNSLALDRLGLTYEQNGEADKAIQAYTQELALDPLGKQRLADAYCGFGFEHQQHREFAAAAAAYQKSMEFGTADDKSCPVQPSEALIEQLKRESAR